MFVGPEPSARALCAGDEASLAALDLAGVTVDLSTGEDADAPSEAATATFTRPPRDPAGRFLFGAHRGACRTIDDCGVSENSVESIRRAEAFGASLVEIDVRRTRDGVPILYHDDTFTPRLSNGTYCHGPVAEFTFAHVRALCRLKYGELVPTLDEALGAALDDTTLAGAWLDVKTVDALAPAVDAARRFGEAARAKGRRFTVVVGMGEADLVDAFVAMGPPDVPCLVELEPDDVRRAGCAFWGPRWTRGPMATDVAALQAEGRGVVYWALDESEYIDAFLTLGHPNALLSDRAGLVRQRFEVLDVPVPAEVTP
jgi:glycerophosphoryl diester phosphodiesterase